MESQLKEKDLVLLTIKRMGINGEGIGYYKRLAVFVPNTLPGEIVEVEITRLEKKLAYGVATKYKTTSPLRIEPKCPYYGKCGGCQLQHLDYQEQLEQKKLMVKEAFDRYYDGDTSKILLFNTLGMENPWNYRNKTQLPVRHDGEKVVVGIYAQDTNKLVYIDKCLVENELITKTMNLILEYLTKANIDIYNPRFRQGNLRYIVLRGFQETNEVQTTFVLMKEEERLIKILKEVITIPNIKSVNYTINNDPKSIEIINNKVINISGKEKIHGKLQDLDFYIHPDSFFQLNTSQTLVLYNEVKKALKPKGYEKVLDCYCGIGSIGNFLANSVTEVRGIDINWANIENANEFARINEIKNAKYYHGEILPYLHEFADKGFVPDCLVIDPPRRGMELNIIKYLQTSRIKKIIYVSCNPSTLVKNLNHLNSTYSIKYIQPIDMFPQTANVECVVCLERR